MSSWQRRSWRLDVAKSWRRIEDEDSWRLQDENKKFPSSKKHLRKRLAAENILQHFALNSEFIKHHFLSLLGEVDLRLRWISSLNHFKFFYSASSLLSYPSICHRRRATRSRDTAQHFLLLQLHVFPSRSQRSGNFSDSPLIGFLCRFFVRDSATPQKRL